MIANLVSSTAALDYKCPNCRLIFKVNITLNNLSLKILEKKKYVCKHCKEIVLLEDTVFFISKKQKINKQENKIINSVKRTLKEYGFSEEESDQKINNVLAKHSEPDIIGNTSVLLKLALVN